MRDLELDRLDVGRFGLGDDGRDSLGEAAHDHLGRVVVVGEHRALDQQGVGGRCVGAERSHRAGVAVQPGHGQASTRHEASGVSGREHASSRGGGELTQRVARDDAGSHAHVRQQASQGDATRQQRRLAVGGLGQLGPSLRIAHRRGAPLRVEQLPERQREDVAEASLELVEGARHGREAVAHVGEHPGALRTLTRVEERHPRRGVAWVETPVSPRRHLPGSDRAELGHQLGNRLGDEAQAGGLRAATRKDARDPGDRRRLVGLDGVRGAPRDVEELVEIGGGHQHQLGLGGRQRRRDGDLRAGPVLWCGRRRAQHDVSVGPTEAEGAHAGQPTGVAPGLRLGRDPERCVVQAELVVRGLEVGQRGHGLVVQRQGRPDHAGDPGGRHRVADVGLGGAEPSLLDAVTDRLHQAVDLGRVADQRARTVRFDVAELGGVAAGVLPRPRDDVGLAGLRRGHRAVAPAVAAQRDAVDQPVDPVAVALSVGEALEDEDAAAFTLDEAVRPGVEGPADALLAHRADAREGDIVVGHQVDVGATRQRRVDRAGAQLLDGVGDRDQAGRAGGVDGVGRAVQVQLLGHGRRAHIREHPRRRVGPRRQHVGDGARDRARILRRLAEVARSDHVGQGPQREQLAVLDRRDAHEDAGSRGQIARLPPGVLDRLQRDLEHEALLRVHDVDPPRRDAEGQRRERPDVVHEGARLGVGLVGRAPLVAGQDVVVPAVAGHRAERVPASQGHLPVTLDVRSACEPATHSDDSDRDGHGPSGGAVAREDWAPDNRRPPKLTAPAASAERTTRALPSH